MPGILLAPSDYYFHHPAYRELALFAINLHSVQSDRYGSELEITVGSKTYKLLSTRQTLSTSLFDVYYLQMQKLLQELLKYDLHDYGLKKDQIDSNSFALVTGDVFDWFLNSGVAERNNTGLPFPAFVAHNTCLQHREFVKLFTFGQYFTMRKFMYTVMGSNFEFLTYKPDNTHYCIGDSDYLPVLVDDPLINGVRVQIYNQSGTIVSTGYYYLQSFLMSGSNVVNGRRSIGVGPANINGGTWNWSINGPLVINNTTLKYTVTLGTLNVMSSIFVPIRMRTYWIDCPCCNTRERIYFLNTRGGVELMAFDYVAEAEASATSTSIKKGNKNEYDIRDGGEQRLSAIGRRAQRYIKKIEPNELEFAYDFLNTVLAWRWNGTNYIPVKILDKSIKVDDVNQVNYLQFELEFSNDYLSQRN